MADEPRPTEGEPTTVPAEETAPAEETVPAEETAPADGAPTVVAGTRIAADRRLAADRRTGAGTPTGRAAQLSHVVTMTPDEAAATLERIAAGLRGGRLHITTADGDVKLRPTRSLRTELRVRGASAALGGRLDIDLSWTRLTDDG